MFDMLHGSVNTQMLHGAGIFTYIYPQHGPNVGKYSIHGASGAFRNILTIKTWKNFLISPFTDVDQWQGPTKSNQWEDLTEHVC